MHELGIAEGILDRAREAAQANGVARVRTLFVTLTTAADFAPETLTMYVEMLSDDDPVFSGVAVEYQEAPAEGVCLSCGATVEVARRGDLACPVCSAGYVRFGSRTPMVQLTGIDADDSGDGAEAGGGA